MKVYLADETDLLDLAAKIAKVIPNGVIIYLSGQLGAGKTTFARGFLRGLGYSGKVKSPTYTLVEPYEIHHQIIYHFDLYRLTTTQELEAFGIRDYFSPEAICLVEWPEKGADLLPKPDIECHLQFNKEGRDISITSYTVVGKKICQELEFLED